jgi:osmotically-inducible protein OsmY
MMRDVSEIDDKTLAVRVENGYVTLAGSVNSRAEAKRLTRLVANIRGVRDVAPLTIVSPSQKRQDHRIAKRLQTMLRQLFIGEDVNVAFFGNTAVLSGNVSSLFTRQLIEQTLEDEDVVDRIFNKLNVKQTGEA